MVPGRKARAMVALVFSAAFLALGAEARAAPARIGVDVQVRVPGGAAPPGVRELPRTGPELPPALGLGLGAAGALAMAGRGRRGRKKAGRRKKAAERRGA